MDTTKIYIKMCEKAEEIQNSIEKDTNYEHIDQEWWASDGMVWLPRQDQLQEMVERDLNILLYRFNSSVLHHPEGSDFHSCWICSYWDKFLTMEQLWLAFVMNKKYGKVWNGEEWTSER